MSNKSISVQVEPEVLKWAISSSGWNNEDIVKKIKISQATISSWINGEINPTLKQLENLANALKRPLAAFFLSEPPKEKPLPKDYRMLPNKEGEFDKKTILAIRRERRLQRVSKELSENLGYNTKPDTYSAKISESSKEIAEKYRGEFKINEGTLRKLKTAYDLFNYLREIIEDKNLLIFQIPMPVEDARGFTLVDDNPAVIVVNSKDKIEARVFSLMHEFGHVLLRESGISMPENSLFIKKIDNVEKWCNEFASAFLLPETIAKEIFTLNKGSLIETKTLENLSRKLKVSKAMLLYNLAKLNFITKPQYDSVIDRYKPDLKVIKEIKNGKTGFAARTGDKKCIDERGQRFVSLVASNVEKGYITHSEALDFLSIKTRNLEKVTSKAKK